MANEEMISLIFIKLYLYKHYYFLSYQTLTIFHYKILQIFCLL